MKSDLLRLRLEPFSPFLDLLVVTLGFGGRMRPPKVVSIRRGTFYREHFSDMCCIIDSWATALYHRQLGHSTFSSTAGPQHCIIDSWATALYHRQLGHSTVSSTAGPQHFFIVARARNAPSRPSKTLFHRRSGPKRAVSSTTRTLALTSRMAKRPRKVWCIIMISEHLSKTSSRALAIGTL